MVLDLNDNQNNTYNMYQITMLGTGYATVTNCFNTCFIIRSERTLLMVDAGGGNGVLQQLNKVNVSLSDIHNLFLTHAHTDHVLGAVWVVRLVMQLMRQDKYNGVLHIWGHDKVLGVLRWICVHTLPQKLTKLLAQLSHP